MTPDRENPAVPSRPDTDDWTWSDVVDLDGQGWLVEAHVVPQDGVPVVRSLRIEPRDELPPGGLTSRFLRRVRFGEITRAAAQDVEGVVQVFPSLRDVIFDTAKAGRRPGRAGHPDEHHLEVAVTYAQAVREGQRPTRAVKERFQVSTETASQMIHDARRKHGLLTDPPRQGVPGGRLTDKALAMLRARQEES